MVEETVKDRVWKIKVHARANKSHFKFKAEKRKPTDQLLKFSIFLKLHEFLLQVKSESQASTPKKKPRALMSRALRIFKSSGGPQVKKETVTAKKSQVLQKPENRSVVNRLGNFASEKPICVGSLLVGTLTYLSGLICAKMEQGLLSLGPCTLLFLVLLFRKYITGKAGALFIFLAIAILSCILALRLDRYLAFDEDDISELVRKAWKYAASSGCLYELSQLFFTR